MFCCVDVTAAEIFTETDSFGDQSEDVHALKYDSPKRDRTSVMQQRTSVMQQVASYLSSPGDHGASAMQQVASFLTSSGDQGSLVMEQVASYLSSPGDLEEEDPKERSKRILKQRWDDDPDVRFRDGDTFEMLLRRKGELGFTLDFWNVGAMVTRVAEGADLEAANLSSPDTDQRTQKFDFLIAVNDAKNTEDMKLALAKSKNTKIDGTRTSRHGACMLRVVRPQSLAGVKIYKEGQPIGLKLVFQDGISCALQIKAIEGGAAAEYNRRCSRDNRLQIDDFIVSVNTHMGPCEELLDALRRAEDEVELTVLRVPRKFLEDNVSGDMVAVASRSSKLLPAWRAP